MALLASLQSLPRLTMTRTVSRLLAWPVESQQTARRNAMLACTSLTQRRMERQDVEDFLVSFYGPSYAAISVSYTPLSSFHPSAAHG